MAACYAGIMLMPSLFGLLGKMISMQLFTCFLIVMHTLTIYAVL